MAAELTKRVQGKHVLHSPKLHFLLMDVHRPEQKKLTIMIGDFVKAQLPYFDVCISNTPYQVGASNIHSMMGADSSGRYLRPWSSASFLIVPSFDVQSLCFSVNLLCAS